MYPWYVSPYLFFKYVSPLFFPTFFAPVPPFLKTHGV